MPTLSYCAPLIPIAMDKPINAEHFAGATSGSTYVIATWIMKIVDWLLGLFGLEHNETLVTFMYAIVVLGVALIVGSAARYVILFTVKKIAKRWSNDMYQYLTSAKFFTKVCRMIPALVFLILIQFSLSSKNQLASIPSKLTVIYILAVTAIALSALVVALWQHIDNRENKKKLPLKGLAQLVKGIIWIITLIIAICIAIDKSPATLLASIGAFGTILLLIFKDSILGLVGGVQLSENESLHVGDWIKVHGTDANGTVTEVTLTSVKVLNWDKTTTTLPPYSLISGSFTNYRSMQQSHTRRVCRSYMIDADSVLPTTPQMLDDIRKVPFMDDYITKKLAQKAAGKVADVDNPEGLVDGTIDTNLGLFRAYMKMWLDANPHISHSDDCFLSTLPQTPTGIPFQVYCFTNTSGWFAYEAIQDTIFEHLAAMLHAFQLYTFENPSGRDTVVDGFLSPGGDIDNVFGIPYPFFQDPNSPDSPASTRVTPKRTTHTVIVDTTPAQQPTQSVSPATSGSDGEAAT